MSLISRAAVCIQWCHLLMTSYNFSWCVHHIKLESVKEYSPEPSNPKKVLACIH